MTTNTYTNLCDSVGAKSEKPCSAGKRTCSMPCLDKDGKCQYLTYPPAKAEQRERLEELIFKANHELFMNDTQGGWQYFYVDREHGSEYICSPSRQESCYMITKTLVEIGVLSKEEVKEALCKNH